MAPSFDEFVSVILDYLEGETGGDTDAYQEILRICAVMGGSGDIYRLMDRLNEISARLDVGGSGDIYRLMDGISARLDVEGVS